MKQSIKNPVFGNGANDKTLNLIKSQLHCTKVSWALKVLCKGISLHNLMPPLGYDLIRVIDKLRRCGLDITQHYNTKQRTWAGTGRPNVVFTYRLSDEDINAVRSLLED